MVQWFGDKLVLLLVVVAALVIACAHSGPLVDHIMKRALVPIVVGLTGSEWA